MSRQMVCEARFTITTQVCIALEKWKVCSNTVPLTPPTPPPSRGKEHHKNVCDDSSLTSLRAGLEAARAHLWLTASSQEEQVSLASDRRPRPSMLDVGFLRFQKQRESCSLVLVQQTYAYVSPKVYGNVRILTFTQRPKWQKKLLSLSLQSPFGKGGACLVTLGILRATMLKVTPGLSPELFWRKGLGPALVAHACKPSYSGGSDQEDWDAKPGFANSSWDPVSKNSSQKKGWWSGSRCRLWVQVPVPQKGWVGWLRRGTGKSPKENHILYWALE
jgi:hypothetical protein